MHAVLLYRSLRQHLDKAEYIYTVEVLSGKVSARSSCPPAWKLAALVPDISDPARADHTGIATYRNSISTSTQIPPSRLRLLPAHYPLRIHCLYGARSKIHKCEGPHQQPSAVLHARILGSLVSRSVGQDGFQLLPQHADEGNCPNWSVDVIFHVLIFHEV